MEMRRCSDCGADFEIIPTLPRWAKVLLGPLSDFRPPECMSDDRAEYPQSKDQQPDVSRNS